MLFTIVSTILMSSFNLGLSGFGRIKSLFGVTQGERAYTNITASQLDSLSKAETIAYLDVRTPGEVAEGKIPGTKVINVMAPDFAEQVSKLDKNATWVVYCRSGNRSATACNIMAEQGFTKLYNLMGGYGAWKNR